MYNITSSKITETGFATKQAAIARAMEIDAEYQPAYGVQVEDADGDDATVWDSEDLPLYFVIVADDGGWEYEVNQGGGDALSLFFGDTPRKYQTRDEAQHAADCLNVTGDWSDVYPSPGSPSDTLSRPRYEVLETTRSNEKNVWIFG